jgi:hypothetical protein
LSSGLTVNMLRRWLPTGTDVARAVWPVGVKNLTTPCASMKYARLLLVLTGGGRAAAAALPHVTFPGLLAWALLATLPSKPTRVTVYVGSEVGVTSTPKPPSEGSGDGPGEPDVSGEGVAVAAGELEDDGEPDPAPPQALASVARTSSGINRFMAPPL